MISIIGSPAQFSQQLLGGFLGNQETMVATPLGIVYEGIIINEISRNDR